MRAHLPMTIMLLAFANGPALAGVVVTASDLDLETKATTPFVVYADADKLKIINGERVVIYRGDLGRAWIITPTRNSYVEITPEAVSAFNALMGGAARGGGAAGRSEVPPQLATLRPEQRARLEALLARRTAGAGTPARPQAAYMKSGNTRTVSKMRCEMYKKTVARAQDEDVCIATLAAAGLIPADFRVLTNFVGFIGQLQRLPQVPRNDFMAWDEMNKAIGFQGMPLEAVHYEGGVPSSRETVERIERSDIPASTFDLPAGLSRQGIPSFQ